MKSLLYLCLVAGSALMAGSSLTHHKIKPMLDGGSFFKCDINGKTFIAAANDSSLTTAFTYTDQLQAVPAALFISAATQEGNDKTNFYIQPINDDAPAAALVANNNLYDNFFITCKATDQTVYNTGTAPGNFEITNIDKQHKTISGKLNCILYSNTKKDWLLITNGRFCFKY